MKLLILSAALAVVTFASAPTRAPGYTDRFVTPVAAASCGLKPLKPLKPVGCKDIYAECLCQGNDCHWEWVCVK